jgi:hypothetical protein
MSKLEHMSELFTGLGVALIILALCIGVGQCDKLMSTNYEVIEQEKTKQLEIQLKREQLKVNKDK